MWSSVLLPLLVAFAAASNNGWKSDTEYVYKVVGRTLTGLSDISSEYSGVLLKATFTVRPKNDGSSLIGQISDGQYAQVFANLPQGWNSPIQSSQVNYKPIPWSGKPFEITMHNGVVKDLIVEKDISNWEANMLKSIVSQIQVDTQGENLIKSSMNQPPEKGRSFAVYKTMEDTVTGRYETLYEINALPEYVLQEEPYLVPFEQIKGDGEIIEVMKTKNYSNADQRSGYAYGLGDMDKAEPSGSKLGDLMSRSSISRIILTGNLQRYTIQHTVTTNRIAVAPTVMNSNQKGIVVSQLNLTLSNMQQIKGQPQGPSKPKSLGNLVYSYEDPFSSDSYARPGMKSKSVDKYASYNYHRSDDQSSSSSSSSSEYDETSYGYTRPRRSVAQDSSSESYESFEYNSLEQEDYFKQPKPQLNEPPQSPLLPFYIGYMGKSIKHSQNINLVNKALQISTEIGQEMQNPNQIPKQHTLSKYVILSSLVRIMNDKEIEQVSQGLYSKDDQTAKGDAWKAFRDAVAESGTGPALLTIQKWILNGKLEQEEAAEIVNGMTQSVRQPTDEYIRSLYQFVTKSTIRSHSKLNVTSILRFSELVNNVYIKKHFSHNEYPVHSFGTFHTKTGRDFVKNEYIPYLTEQLRNAVAEGDSHKIQVYIRALGNVGHPDILKSYEPYIEGQQQVSQFQRLHIVYSLEELVRNYPKVARPLLYRIYQNPGEHPDVRIAAVYQLLRTGPSPTMLQRMAEYTNIERNEQVNSAVKSIIQHASHLKESEFNYKRPSAKSAESFLINREYSARYAHAHKHLYGKDEATTFQYIGSYDDYLPKALRLAYRSKYADYNKQYFSLQSAVSSVDSIMKVFMELVQEYVQNMEKQQQKYPDAAKFKWSSENIVRMLDIQVEELEQAEGNLVFKLGGFKRFYTVDNQTMRNLPNMIKDIQNTLREGKAYRYTKYYNRYEIAISFPTEMALPFVYTYDVPSVLNFGSKTSVTVQPEISTGSKLRIPDSVQSEGQLQLLLSYKVQGQLGFITPCDHQQYVSGYEKSSHFHLPISHKFGVDFKKREIQAEIEIDSSEKDVRLAYYKSTPYVGHYDILDLQPVMNRQNTQIVGPSAKYYHNTDLGKKSTGMVFRFGYAGDNKYLDYRWLYDQIQYYKNYHSLLSMWESQDIANRKYSVDYLSDQSVNKHFKASIKCLTQYYDAPQMQNVDEEHLYQSPEDSQQRLEDFAKKASAGIHSARVIALDAMAEFGTDKLVQYRTTSSYGRSKVDDTSRVLLYYSRKSNNPDVSPYYFAVSVKNHFAAHSEMDPDSVLNSDVSGTVQAHLAFGQNIKSGSKMDGQLKFRRSNSRTQYLQQSPLYKQCQKEKQEGNKQLHACEQITNMAKYSDYISMQWQYQNVEPAVYNLTRQAYTWFKYYYYYHSEDNFADGGHGKEGQLNVEIGFSPDYSMVNASVTTYNYRGNYYNVRLHSGRYLQENPATYWVASHLPQLEYGKPTCVADQTAVSTFDNFTYHAQLSQSWTVMMVHTPLYARSQGHEQKELLEYMKSSNNYAVLVRDAGSQKKQIKIYLRTVETDSQKVEIDLKPSKQNPSVLVNGKQQQYNDKQVTRMYNDYVQMYALPNGEVKVEVSKEFSVVYDGSRVKVRLHTDRYFSSVRGLCGNANGMRADDLRAPEDCALRTPQELVQAYTISEGTSRSQGKRNNYKSGCYDYKYVYGNPISNWHGAKGTGVQDQSGCTKYQTKYVPGENNQICFTIRQLPTCQRQCKATKTIEKSVAVHCVQKSNISDMWKAQIDKGASPDFGLKAPTMTIRIDVPQGCRRS